MRLDRGAFRLDHQDVTIGEVLAGHLIGGSLAPLVAKISERHAAAEAVRARGESVDEEQLQEAFDAWRQDRDLIAAEEMEHWLEHHGLDVDDVVAHLERVLLARARGRRPEGDPEAVLGLDELLELIPHAALIGGSLPSLVEDFALHACAPDPAVGSEQRAETARRWMLAEAGFADEAAYVDAAAALDVDPGRARWAFDREVAYRLHVQDVVTQEALRQGLAELREELIRYEISTATLATEDVAREVACCVREDRDSFSRAAARAGETARRSTWFHSELPRAPFGERLASTRALEVIGPDVLPDGRAAIGQLRAAHEPELGEPDVLHRVERRLVERSLRRALQQRVLFPPSAMGGLR